jgi:2-polyprenyl-6-methoxyphenol hydroxylase and related FAD-dependent oxidoreductases
MAQTDVLIIGAGPTGLVLALWLTRLGVKVRIIDKSAEPEQRSRPWQSRPAPLNFTGSSISPRPCGEGPPGSRRQSLGKG